MPRVASAEAALGRLAVDQKPRPGGGAVRQLRAVAAALLADDEQQSDARFTVAPQPIGRRNLRGENALARRTRRGRRGDRRRCGSERTAARSRSGWTAPRPERRAEPGIAMTLLALAVHRLLGHLEPQLAQAGRAAIALPRLRVRLSNRCR